MDTRTADNSESVVLPGYAAAIAAMKELSSISEKREEGEFTVEEWAHACGISISGARRKLVDYVKKGHLQRRLAYLNQTNGYLYRLLPKDD